MNSGSSLSCLNLHCLYIYDCKGYVMVKVYFTIIHNHYTANNIIITTYGKGTEAAKLIYRKNII